MKMTLYRVGLREVYFTEDSIYNENDLYRVGLREVYITEDYIEVPIYNENDFVM